MTTWYSVGGTPDYFLRYERACYVPGVECSVCRQTWAIHGLIYPSVVCSRLPKALRREAGTAAPGEFRALVAALHAHLGDDRLLYPGSDLGPPTGPLKRQPPMVFHELSSLYVGSDVVADREFRALGVKAVPFVGRTARGKEYELFEIEAWPVARQTRLKMQRTKLQHCEVCGYRATQPYRYEPLLASSLEGHHIAREVDSPSFSFISEAFRAVLERYRRRADDLELKPVKVV